MTQERLFQLTSHPQSRPSTSSSSHSADYNQQSRTLTPGSEVYSEIPSPAHSMHSQQSQNHHQFGERDECFEETHYDSNVLSEALSSVGLNLHDVTML